MTNDDAAGAPETNLIVDWLRYAGPRRPALLRAIHDRFRDNRQAAHIYPDQCDCGECDDVGVRLGAAMLDVLARDHQISRDELRSLLDHPDQHAADAVARLALRTLTPD